jgi:tetratricopeptide (TPR) repeat protein
MTTSSTRSRCSQVAALLTVLCLALPAVAAKPKARVAKAKPAKAGKVAPASGQAEAAKEHFAAGRRFYDLGNFAQALESYTAAYQAMPLPAFLFNIAQCHRQLSDFSRARFFYRRYLDLSKTRPANADQVEALIGQCDEKIAELERLKREEAAAKAQAEAEAKRKEEERLLAERRQAEVPGGVRALTAAPGTDPAHVSAVSAPPLTSRWWLWTGVGVLAAGAATGAYLATKPGPRETSLGVLGAP